MPISVPPAAQFNPNSVPGKPPRPTRAPPPPAAQPPASPPPPLPSSSSSPGLRLPPHLRARLHPHLLYPPSSPPHARPHHRPHPHHRSSLLRYLFPFPFRQGGSPLAAVREHYRERLLRFRAEVLPRYKLRVQSGIYRFIVERQRKRQVRKRLAPAAAAAGGAAGGGGGCRVAELLGRRGLAANPAVTGRGRGVEAETDAGRSGGGGGGGHAVAAAGGAELADAGEQQQGTARGKMQQEHYGGGLGYRAGYGYASRSARGTPPPPLEQQQPQERGSRRRRLAAVAGSVYRAGVAAASELREQYNNTRVRGGADLSDSQVSIPGAFPQVSIVTKGDEQMVLFPTYAKRHVREFGAAGRSQPGQPSFQAANAAQMGMGEEEYWKQEWARLEDEKAVVDVDVRGWIYMPSKGPMTRRNRMLVGLARRLSGIPPPTMAQAAEPAASSHEEYEEMREEQRIAREAREIERRGQDEKEVATRGGYSESPGGSKGEKPAPVSPPPSPTLSGRTGTMSQTDMTEAELAVANANLMARLGPFMTTPLVQIPITIFFYNDEQSRSHTVLTDDSGHFGARVALEFVPTDVRVIANENISTTRPVEVIDSRGVSLISDVDDTVKRSNIWMGAREIFRNTFVRELADLTVDGVREWYHAMHEMGVKVHYCSNSPWQLFPVLATFFHTAGLPQGSIHLKQYSGMLQGIFEPVAERKKGTLEAIIRDFPERKFLLVGDSGEADLEVYTELALANPGRILAVFIRDVTTPDQTGFFDSSFSLGDPAQHSRQGSSNRTGLDTSSTSDEPRNRPQLPPRATAPPPSSGPIMGTLIDLDEPAEASTAGSNPNQNSSESRQGPAVPVTLPKKPPPPRPAKPAALRSSPSDASTTSHSSAPVGSEANLGTAPHQLRSPRSTPPLSSKPTPPPPPPPRRRGTAPAAQQPQPQAQAQLQRSETMSSSDAAEVGALPSRTGTAYSASIPASTATAAPATGAGTAVINKKVDLWLRRLARAHEILDAQGVKLYTWRRGDEVMAEAEGIVREALQEMREGG